MTKSILALLKKQRNVCFQWLDTLVQSDSVFPKLSSILYQDNKYSLNGNVKDVRSTHVAKSPLFWLFVFSFADVKFPAEAAGSFVWFEVVETADLNYSSHLCLH